jgi:hypothetical protein
MQLIHQGIDIVHAVYESSQDTADDSPSPSPSPESRGFYLISGGSTRDAAGGKIPPGYFPNLTGGLSPGAHGYAWGDAPWGYGKGPGWGNAGNYDVSGESQDANNLALALMSQGDVTYSGPGEPIEFEGRRWPLGGGDLKRAVQW